MAFHAKHPDYAEHEELFYAALNLYYVVYRKGVKESLVEMNAHTRFLIHSIADPELTLGFYRIPAAEYDIQVAFETLPVRTIDYYLW
jgi:hypothetical protein